MSEELFTTKMRKATRKAHAVSDTLVNAKLLFALNSDAVWAEGLLIFYEIFKFLEIQMKESSNKNLGKLYCEEMNRTSAFEKDLKFYLGNNWKDNYTIRESVKNYLKHLEYLSVSNSDLLMAYVYHLYMGLLSGGQILQKKRELKRKIVSGNDKEGEAITKFTTKKISELKSDLRSKINEIADHLDDGTKALLIEESIKVFELNNSIIKSVKGAESVAFKNLFYALSFVVLLAGISFHYYNKFFVFAKK